MVSYPALGRKFVNAPIDQIDECAFKKIVSDCIQADHGNVKSIAKEVGDMADASPETAKTWMQGISTPGFFKGLKLAAKTPSLAKEVVRLIAMEAALDPEQQQALAAFLRTVGK